jgi:hypothetical protein
MSLSPAEQHVLDSIEDGLAGTDSHLRALLAVFTWLADGEEMPAREQIPSPRPWWRGGGTGGAHRGRPGAAWPNFAVVLWLTTAVALITVAVVLGGRRGTGGTCSRLPAVACVWQAPGHAVGAAVHSLVFRP